MSLLSYIIPQTVLKTSSPYNPHIRINEEKGRYKLLSGGAKESGEYIEKLWLHAFEKFQITESRSALNILVLGVAGGTVIHLLHGMYPNASIVGVDIDNVMIEVGKKYFGLSSIPSLQLVCADASTFVRSYKGPRFDCVVVDIFTGPDVPDFVISHPFEKRVRRLLTHTGCTIINYLRQPGYEKKVLTLQKILEKSYTSVLSTDRFNNRFFLAK